ncbi:hypothetical protein Hanom_Chr05g00411351 [Helianthus anomalus]
MHLNTSGRLSSFTLLDPLKMKLNPNRSNLQVKSPLLFVSGVCITAIVCVDKKQKTTSPGFPCTFSLEILVLLQDLH